MAELEVGAHCQFKTCKQIDFLPFECASCSGIFCKNHRTEKEHCCSRCNVDPLRPEYSGPKGYPCHYQGCNNRELTQVLCNGCKNNFCLSHRHQQDHLCPEYEAPSQKMTKTAEHVKQIVDSKKEKPRKPTGAKSKKTAAKVALMKLKMNAVGAKGLPDTEKVYFQVFLPLQHTERSKAMLFSKKWLLGKVIDSISTTAGLQNDNNVSTSTKLRLFDGFDGALLPVEESLEKLMADDDGLVNGGSVILEYVNTDCDSIEDTSKYKVG